MFYKNALIIKLNAKVTKQIVYEFQHDDDHYKYKRKVTAISISKMKVKYMMLIITMRSILLGG